ncbi:MAG: hypothetical protein NVV63_00140 [Opitutus sp.]|nr:hypothetical protein [Opitutus sp.]
MTAAEKWSRGALAAVERFDAMRASRLIIMSAEFVSVEPGVLAGLLRWRISQKPDDDVGFHLLRRPRGAVRFHLRGVI